MLNRVKKALMIFWSVCIAIPIALGIAYPLINNIFSFTLDPFGNDAVPSPAYSTAAASSAAETDERDSSTTQGAPAVVSQNITELHFDFHAKDVIIVVAVIACVIVAFFIGKTLISAYGIKTQLADYFDDKKHRGAYVYNFEGAGGMLKMKYKDFMTLFEESPGRYCVLHDDRRRIVQLILFNPAKLFPYKMLFDYNSAYGKKEHRYNRYFKNCSYIQLSRHDRKKLAASLRRSRFDSDGARFGTNELSSCGCMTQDANRAVVEAKATCAQEMEKQKTIISNIAASTPNSVGESVSHKH